MQILSRNLTRSQSCGFSTLKHMRICALRCLVIFTTCVSGSALAQPAIDPEGFSGWTEKPGWHGTRDMIVAAHPLAAAAGQDILDAGGSAVDAAIAAQLVLGLVEPQSSGLGGGGFMLATSGTTVYAYDGRETAPAEATPELFEMPDGQPMRFFTAAVGGRSVGVPGLVRMLEKAHQAHGRLPWPTLFQPAIRLAERGFPLGHRLAALLRQERYLADDPEARAYFYDTRGAPHVAGTTLRNPALAQTLRAIAAGGSEVFYSGNIARDMVRKVRYHPRNPGLLSLEDMAGYRAVIRPALCAPYRQWRVCGMPPPSSGGLAVAQVLGILEALPPTMQIGAYAPHRQVGRLVPLPEAVHLISEAERLAYADRARYVGDPDRVAPPAGRWSSLLDPIYLQQRAALISERSFGQASAGIPGHPSAASEPVSSQDSLELPSTTHLVVVDRYGNSVSMTTSIENQFGARLMVRGFLLNNQLTDFAFTAAHHGRPAANRVEGGKRPRSSMAPTLVFAQGNDRLVLALGSPGGSAIIPYVVKTIIATLDWGLDLQSAISLPNFGARGGPTELEADRFPADVQDALRNKGHQLRITQLVSGVHGLAREERRGQSYWFGAADPRREGTAAGTGVKPGDGSRSADVEIPLP
jgi:gamma-glutamyltranspeptidase/glutathione hydrolase